MLQSDFQQNAPNAYFNRICTALHNLCNSQKYTVSPVSKSNNGILVFNAFIDKEYAPRGQHAPLIIRPLVILGYWVQVLTGR